MHDHLNHAGGLRRKAPGGGEEDEHQQRLESEHRPVARLPHPPAHHPEEERRAPATWTNSGRSPFDLDPGDPAGERQGGDRDGDRGADRDDERPLALAERLERLAGRPVSLLGPRRSRGSAARCRSRCAPRSDRLGRARPRALRLRRSARFRSRLATGRDLPAERREGAAQRRRRRGRVVGVADRPHDGEPLGAGLDHLVGVAGSMPPIA